MNTSQDTYFLPVERADDATIARQREKFTRAPFLGVLGDAVPEGLVILNEQRQVVYANEAFRHGFPHRDSVIGLRLGEAVDCEHSADDPAGCGTTRYCVHCGAAQAMKQTLSGRPANEECRIVRDPVAGGEIALDLRVWTTPLEHEDEPFMILAASDISHEKRRRALEHIFFHDVNNTAGLIQGLTRFLTDDEELDAAQRAEFQMMLSTAAGRLIEEIQTHRQLLAAESGDLELEVASFDTDGFLFELAYLFQSHQVARDRRVVVDERSHSLQIRSDLSLLSRVLGNMVKNALEASPAGSTVTIGCRQMGDDAGFWVHNEGYMPRHVQMQLFQRSFSTKGTGRGLGTYSMKLLSERYLNGVISFTSTPENGTTFYALFPLEKPD